MRYADVWETAVTTVEHWPRGRRAKDSQPTSVTGQCMLVFKELTPQEESIRQYREENGDIACHLCSIIYWATRPFEFISETW